MMSEAKIKAKKMLLQYGISKITLENLLYIIEQQNFQIIEYSQEETNNSVWDIIKKLKLTPYAKSGKAFAYQQGKTKMIFLCEELTADEKLYALAHEEGHILSGHFGSSNSVEQEQMANEIAHYLLHPPLFVKLRIAIVERKKLTIAILSVILCITIALIATSIIVRNNSYYGEYYITENGTKYHEKDCMIIKDKNNTDRLTKAEFESGEYEPCQVCLPD